jgi:hypothetical protein
MYNFEFVGLQVLGQESGIAAREAVLEFQIEVRQKLVRPSRTTGGERVQAGRRTCIDA